MINVIQDGYKRTTYLNDEAKATLIFAHGAGAGNKHTFIVDYAMSLAKLGFNVVTFNFPYMQTVYETEKRRPPNRAPQLLEYFQLEIEMVKTSIAPELPLFLIGKSMGGRMASLLAADVSNLFDGLIVLGYPFIPPGKPEKLEERIAHFPKIVKPTLILQGERDSFGGTELIQSLKLPKNMQTFAIPDGDHSFKPRKASGYTELSNMQLTVSKIEQFVTGQLNE